MATRGRKRKAGPRTKNGRLSRAYKSTQLRDEGTAEFRAKRLRLINGSDPALAASTSGILHANGFLSAGQHHAALRYAWAHAVVFGRPWRQACPLADPIGQPAPDQLVELAHRALEVMDAKLDPEQRLAVANLSVFGSCRLGSTWPRTAGARCRKTSRNAWRYSPGSMLSARHDDVDVVARDRSR